MEKSEEKFDGFFAQVLNDARGYEGFFTNIFSFLRRKTDFFSNSKVGEEIVAKVGKTQVDIYLKEKKAREHAAQEKKAKEEKAEVKKPAETQAPSKKIGPDLPTIVEPKKEKEKEPKKEGEEPKSDKLPPNSGNGSKTDIYYWTQTLEEVQIQIPLEKEVTKKNLIVDLGITNCKVARTDGSKVYIDDDWCDKIHVDDSTWVIIDEEKSKILQISLLKWKNTMIWWDCLVKKEPKIDTQKVNPEPGKLSDLDGETRTTVEKMMFDMRQKQMGLPTSEELEKREKLKDFMKAHPEMDFSNAKFS